MPATLRQVRAAGARRVAVVRAITGAQDPGAATSRLLDLLGQASMNPAEEGGGPGRMDPGQETITIVLNGECHPCPAGLDLEGVLRALGMEPRLVVVELNGTIVPRQRWKDQPVVESDALEVVTIVGGGS